MTFHYGSSLTAPSHLPLLRTEQMLRAAVRDGAFPGAAYGVLERGILRGLGSVGRFTYESDSPLVLPSTSFDLASVSKVLATTAMAMLLYQRGALLLDTPVAELLPAFLNAGDKEARRAVTLRLLLAHASGLPAYVRLFERCRGAEAMRAAVLALPLEHPPGTHAAYSDPGFILLGMALEVLAGETLLRYTRREIFAPLGMAETRFQPLESERASIPPTEEDRHFRHRRIQGEVHDENCFSLDGVSGHAGLFAPTADVLRFGEAMLLPLRNPENEGLFSAETVRVFTARAAVVPDSSRALGWDTPSGSPSSSGHHLGRAAFGHLGFTGTSLWLDPVRDLGIVLLTNRSFPARENQKIREIRPVFHDTIIDELDTGTSA